jgi:hypothetical protein
LRLIGRSDERNGDRLQPAWRGKTIVVPPQTGPEFFLPEMWIFRIPAESDLNPGEISDRKPVFGACRTRAAVLVVRPFSSLSAELPRGDQDDGRGQTAGLSLLP